MQKKSLIKQNILQFIDFKGISKYKFYQKTGITRGVLDQNNGMSEENTAKFLAYYPEINIEWLLTGKGSMIKSEKKEEKQEVAPIVEDKPTTITVNGRTHNLADLPYVVKVDDDDNEKIPLVNVKARAGYIRGYDNMEYIEELPICSMPYLHNGTYRMFEIDGISMYPTLQNEGYVIAEYCSNVEHINDNRVYVIITEDDMVVKRVIKKKGKILCISDNSDYEQYHINNEDIKEIWRCIMSINKDLSPMNYNNSSNITNIEEFKKQIQEKDKQIQQLFTMLNKVQ